MTIAGRRGSQIASGVELLLMGERGTFLRSFLAHPREVGAVLPTSRRAVSDMLDLARIEDALLIVEFGAGSGVYTRELLRRMGPDARLLAFEVDEQLVATLGAEVDDPRLELVTASAEEVESHLDGGRVDILVSALPFTSLPTAVRRRVLDVSPGILAPQGVMLVLQYSPLVQRDLERRFASVERRLSPLNVPPAFLFRCTEPVAAR
ncbi:MAG: methyltransferase domain-containing protein [Actinomycetota bacterium]|nr:methyltransferase domain-containing protein [Actinomycetota bacterium]